MSQETEDGCITFLIGLLLGVALAFAGAFVEWKFWGWFAVPIGMPILTYWQVMGLGMLVGIATSKLPVQTCKDTRTPNEKNETVLWNLLTRLFFFWPLSLFIGWLVSFGV